MAPMVHAGRGAARDHAHVTGMDTGVDMARRGGADSTELTDTDSWRRGAAHAPFSVGSTAGGGRGTAWPVAAGATP